MTSHNNSAPKSALSDIGIIAMVPDNWDTFWQPRHHILSRLATFFPTVWIEPAADWRKLSPSWATRRSPDRSPDCPGLGIYPSKSWPPRFYRPGWLASLTFRDRLRRARQSLLDQKCQKIVLYLWRPEYASALEAIPHDFSCYHIDDEYSFSSIDLPIPENELHLLRSADQIFIHSRALMQKKGAINRHTSFIPNGVDYSAYATPVTEPADLAAVPHPRIGYTGYLKKQLDWQLLSRLAKKHPAWSFVFVGPQLHRDETGTVIDELSSFPNVYFLGAKPTSVLATYPQHFDVNIMPYRLDDYTKYIYPLKLHEYLASGNPTVGARLPVLDEFSDLVALPDTDAEWSEAIVQELQPAANSEARRAARQFVAQQYDWATIVQRLAEIMTLRIGQTYSDRFGEWTHAQQSSTQSHRFQVRGHRESNVAASHASDPVSRRISATIKANQ
ncbi:MAG TPA: glycosyltransferase [Candidatus Acidoferrum sp.]